MEVIQAIQQYPMQHVIDRFRKDHDIPSSLAAEYETELKRFFALCALNPTKFYGMAGAVDDLWHTFILHSVEYRLFCDKYVGGFLDHYPDRIYVPAAAADGAAVPETDDTLIWYAELLADYRHVFKAEPPAHVWPPVEAFPPPGAATMQVLCRVCGTSPWS